MIRLNELLGTEFPIVQGGMANIATAEFAAAVSNTGALGLIAGGGMDAAGFRESIRRCRTLTDRPFGVNIMLMHPQAEEMADIAAEERVAVITTGAGELGTLHPRWKESGAKVFPVVGCRRWPGWKGRAGADGVIAEAPSPADMWGSSPPWALVPQVCDAVGIPVVAAGGIADARQLLAAMLWSLRRPGGHLPAGE